MLFEETDVRRFEKLLDETRKQLKTPKTEVFSKCFEAHYVQIKTQWAICYRKKSNINTNMYVESFHRVINFLYLKGKTNKRVDKCIQMLIKYERDKIFQRLSKFEKGKPSSHITIIKKRHISSKSLSKSQVHEVDKTTLMVKSEDLNNEYTVVKENAPCIPNCVLKCQECNTCIHTYCCNCMDALVHHTMYKHIHLVASTQAEAQDMGKRMEPTLVYSPCYKRLSRRGNPET